MGYQEAQILRTRINRGNGEELTHETQERCREVASQLRLIGDTLETSYIRNSDRNSGARLVVGVTLVAIATNIVLRHFFGLFSDNRWVISLMNLIDHHILGILGQTRVPFWCKALREWAFAGCVWLSTITLSKITYIAPKTAENKSAGRRLLLLQWPRWMLHIIDAAIASIKRKTLHTRCIRCMLG